MNKAFLFLLLTIFSITGFAQFSVSSNKRFLLKDGQPFFWLGDTGWELFHRLDRNEADQYLKKRTGVYRNTGGSTGRIRRAAYTQC